MGIPIRQQDRFIIGLTGNIGTGKTTVLNMLRHLGAYGIDADEITKKVYTHPAAQKAVSARFGPGVASEDGQVDKTHLAEIVFKNEQALRELEAIIHPFVTSAVVHLINTSRLPIIVIEAIKLLESDLVSFCDSIWVVDANQETIIHRLTGQRGMSVEQVESRLSNQSPVHEKIAKADVVITNSSDLQTTWQAINQNWRNLRENNSKFLNASDQANAFLFEFKDHFLDPYSEAFFNYEPLLTNGHPLEIISSNQPLTLSALERFSVSSFIFPPSDAPDDDFFTIWKLNTFSVFCQDILLPDSKSAIKPKHMPITEIEYLANLHHIEEIILPIPSSLKEESLLLREKGYTLAARNMDDFTHWNKAGYNLLIKRLWDSTVIFEKEKVQEHE